MARKPQTSPEQEKEDNTTSEPEKEQEQVKDTSTKDNTPEQEKEDKTKVYTFKSKNPFLSCVSLGVQFVDGKATVTDVAVARALATIDGVDLVEE